MEKVRVISIIFFMILMAGLVMTGCDERNRGTFQIISVTIDPAIIYADSIETTYANVTVRVGDEDGNPGQNMTVNFETDIGYIWAKEETNESGMVTTRFYDTGITGVAHLFVYLNGEYDNGMHKTIDIYPYPHYTIRNIIADPAEIYADEGATRSEIRVLVKDQDNIAARGQEVEFSSDIGYINSPAVTDSLGYARTEFWDDGTIGTASIIASIGISDSTISVLILPTLPVMNLILDLPVGEVTVNEVITISARAYNAEGLVPDGSIVNFTTIMGNFQISANNANDLGQTVSIMTINGIAEAYLNTGIIPGNNPLTAESDGISDTEVLYIEAGDPSEMTVTIINSAGIEQDVIEAGSPEILQVRAEIIDDFGNPVSAGNQVFFTGSLGIMDSLVITGNDGIAISHFSAGPVAGTALIAVRTGNIVESRQITITADGLDNIVFENQQLLLTVGTNIPVASAISLHDQFGNLITTPVEVWFKFFDRPEGDSPQGSNINQEVYNLTDAVNIISEDGYASIWIYPGTTAGFIGIEAWCTAQPGEMISAIFHNIIVEAGQPEEIFLCLGEIDSGDNLGDGTWEIQLSALVMDTWGNPVEDGIEAYFSIDPTLDYVAINSPNAYVGNLNMDGNQTAGTAFSTIVFDGSYTNESFSVNVDAGNVYKQEDLILPLQQGSITMLLVPSHLDWHEGNAEEEVLYTQCRINVKDGQNNPVNNQRVVFTTTLGFPTDEGEHGIHPLEDEIDPYYLQLFDFTYINAEDPPDDSDGYTGPYDGALGRLYKDVGFYKYECPPPIGAGSGMTSGTINATIFGTTTSANQTIHLFRYFD
ncbi:MAG: Ig-like domain-containing protein [Candidatus Cloacimonetes bacterium]|nr:Ig-like domain-containing protein [Candidatus Cloacimonadota bacterium]